MLGTDAEGSGLGLSIVKTLVERAGASVTLEPALPDALLPGLRVRVKIPVSAKFLEHETRDALDTKGTR